MNNVKITILFANHPSDKDLKQLADIQSRGAVVTYQKYNTYTATKFAKEHGMNKITISRLMKHPNCPEIQGGIGASGRVTNFINTDALVEFLTQGKKANLGRKSKLK